MRGGDLVLKLLLTLTSVALSLVSAGTSPAWWEDLSRTLRCPTFAEAPHRGLVMERSELSDPNVVLMS